MSKLAGTPGVELRLLPSGLFCGEGARPMDDDFAAYAWSNDQRIERLTGQPFTERYRNNVLTDRQQMFDSGPATVALTAVALTAPEHELAALEAIQHARYVDGQNITAPDTLVAVLRTLGLDASRAATRRVRHGTARRQPRPASQRLKRCYGSSGRAAFPASSWRTTVNASCCTPATCFRTRRPSSNDWPTPNPLRFPFAHRSTGEPS